MNFENMINNIAANAEKANAAAPDDYINDEDGLLYCGKCNTPKQCRVDLLGKVQTVYCICKCRSDELEAERAREKWQEWQRHVVQLRRYGFPDAEMKNWTFDKDDHENEKLTTIAKNYVKNFAEMKKRGKGLLLFGSVGTGKTFMSACIANALIDQGRACLVTNFSRLVNEIQNSFEGKQQKIDRLNDFDLLVIDDLAAERDTEYMGEIVQTIIDNRYRAGLPLIITTNLTSQELKHPSDMRKQRIYSRLFEMCFPVEVEGKDRRKKILKDEYNEIGELLGLNVAESNDEN